MGNWFAAAIVGAVCLVVASCGDEEDSRSRSAGSGGGGSGGASSMGGQGTGLGQAGEGGGGASLEGTACEHAAPITELDTEVTLGNGAFDGSEPLVGSCGSDGGAWFRFTAETPGCYSIRSGHGTGVFNARAVFSGLQCDPPGSELDCISPVFSYEETELYLGAGEGCLIVVSSAALWQPWASVSLTSSEPGRACETAYDLSGEILPFVLSGTFPCDAPAAGSCAPETGNAAWFKYVAASSGPHTITATNLAGSCASQDICDSRIAVFEGDGCSPLGVELSCAVAAETPAASTTVTLQQGAAYLIAFSTDVDGDSTTVDVRIDISP